MNNAATKAARWLVLSLPLMVALVFSGAFSTPFTAPKNAVFVFISCSLAALALIDSAAWKPEREQRCFWIAVAAYLVLTGASAIMANDCSMCIEGVELSLCGVLLLRASLQALAGDGLALNLRNLQISMAIAGILVSLATAAQFLRLDVGGAFGLHSSYSGRMRMYATLGNPDFVAAFLAVAVQAAIGLSIAKQSWRTLWLSASVLMGVAILMTGSRGGAIALAAGVAVLAFTVGRPRALARAALIAGVVAACAIAAGTRLNPRTPCESLRGRVFIWQVSLQSGAAQSAFGSGPGTFAYDYPVRLGQFFSEPGRESLLHFAGHERHAQNDFVEAWHDEGWLGLGALLALLGTWFAVAIRNLRQSGDASRPVIAGAIASVSALCVASLFDFPMHRAETWALLWLSMAIPLASPKLQPAPQRRLLWLRYAGAALIVVAGSYAAFASLASSYELAKGESAEDRGTLESSLASYRAALRWKPSSPDANFDLVRALAKTGDDSAALAQSTMAARYLNEPELSILRSRILHNAGRDGDARRELVTAARRFPYSAQLRHEVSASSPLGEAAQDR